MLSEQYDYVVIDGEAGIEQINRRVMEKVTHLLLVTDASRKGCQVVQTIKQVADELVMYEKIGVIANRLPEEKVTEIMDMGGLPLLSAIGSVCFQIPEPLLNLLGCFSGVGTCFAKQYIENPRVKAVQTYFVTDSGADYGALQKYANRFEQITESMNLVFQGFSMDCSTCGQYFATKNMELSKKMPLTSNPRAAIIKQQFSLDGYFC